MALEGLVLHSSRCGSTLVLRALECWPGIVGVDEPPELDDALAAVRRGGDAAALEEVLARLGDRGERVVVKTDAWHVLELDRLLAAAGVPWIFVHRHPVEVLVSHRREPGSHTVPGVLDPIWFGPPAGPLPLPHSAAVLARILAAAAEHADSDCLVDHADLPDALLTTVAARFGLDPAGADPARLAEVLAQHAKHPHLAYVDDRADKRASAGPDLVALAADVVGPSYAALVARARRSAA